MKASPKVDAAIAAAAQPAPAPMAQFILNLENGRAGVLMLPEDTTDIELIGIMVTIGSHVRARLVQDRMTTRPRILVPQ